MGRIDLGCNQDDSPAKSLVKSSAATVAPQMTHPLSISAVFIESFTFSDSSHAEQTKTYSLPRSLLIVFYVGRSVIKDAHYFRAHENDET